MASGSQTKPPAYLPVTLPPILRLLQVNEEKEEGLGGLAAGNVAFLLYVSRKISYFPLDRKFQTFLKIEGKRNRVFFILQTEM